MVIGILNSLEVIAVKLAIDDFARVTLVLAS
jgi:hypothetical protein